MSVRAFAALALAASLPLAGCEGEDVTPPEPRCSEVRAWQNWSMGWAQLNHRISRIGVAFADPSSCAPDTARLDFVGGDFTSGGVATDQAQFAGQTRRLVFDSRVAGASRVVVTGRTRAPEGVVEGTLEVDLAEHGLEAYADHIVWIDGFAFDTDVEQRDDYPTDYDPALGWTSRGLGFGAEVDGRDGDILRVAWRARFEAGVSDDYTIREDMNLAVPYAEVGVELHIGVLGVAGGVSSRAVDVTYGAAFDEPFAFTEELEPMASESARSGVAAGAPMGPSGFWLPAGLDLRLHPDLRCEGDSACDASDRCIDGQCAESTGPQGYYVRALGGGVESAGYDAERGEAEALATAYASSASLLLAFRPLVYEASQTLVWVQLEASQEATPSEATWVVGEHMLSL